MPGLLQTLVVLTHVIYKRVAKATRSLSMLTEQGSQKEKKKGILFIA